MVKIAFAVTAGLYCIACLALYLFQRDLVFGPHTERVSPENRGLQKVEEVTLWAATGSALYSWYAKARPGKLTILYLHGNGGSVSTRADRYPQFAARGYGVFMLGYPGYGGSEGEPSEQAFVDAAKVAYQYLRESSLEPENIVLFGESLGSSVAVQLAATVPARALVLAAPMNSIREIAEQQYPFVPLKLLLKDPFLTYQHIGAVDMPLLVIHGSADEAIPVDSGRRLYEQANQPKTFQLVEGAGHNNLFDFALVDLLEKYLTGLPEQ